MIEKIEEFEKRGLRISIFPQRKSSEWVWTAGVYIGDSTRANWIPDLNNCTYSTYKEAFNAAVKYCETSKA